VQVTVQHKNRAVCIAKQAKPMTDATSGGGGMALKQDHRKNEENMRRKGKKEEDRKIERNRAKYMHNRGKLYLHRREK
jgi:hypothetical protein